MPQAPQQSGLALARLGHQQGVPAQQDRRKVDRYHASHTILDDPEACAASDRLWKGQKSASSGALDEGHVVP
jgi:hypothetical protein